MSTFLACKYNYDGGGSEIHVKATPRSIGNTICLRQWLRVTGIKLKAEDGWQEIRATFTLLEEK